MAIIKYSPGKDGVVRESISTDGGKTFKDTGGNSKSGYNYNVRDNGSGYGEVYNTKTGQTVQPGAAGSSYSGSSGSSSSSSNKTTTTTTPAPAPVVPTYTPPTSSGVTSQYGYDAGWNNYTGNTGKQYSVAGSNGTIQVYNPETKQTTKYLPTDEKYSIALQAMMADGVNYTPSITYTNANGTYTTKSYTQGNSDLQYALQQMAQEQRNNGQVPDVSVNSYAKSMYDRVGTKRADGSIITLQDVTSELTRLGLQDYLPENAVYTAGRNLLPGNEFGRVGADTTGDEGNWYYYGGQQYRLDGDMAQLAQYANAKTGQISNADYIFGDLLNNPLVRSDADLYSQLQQNASLLNQSSGAGANQMSMNQTTSARVNDIINYVNSANSYYANNGGGGVDLLSMIQQMLDSGLENNQQFIAQQRQMAQEAADKQANQAYVQSLVNDRKAREAMSAQGLGTSGAVQSAMMGNQALYGQNVNAINSNLMQMLSSLSGQEVQLLTDYYKNMADYSYQVSTDEANRAIQQAQLEMQRQQMAYDEAYRQQQLAMQQAQYDWERKNTQGQQYWDMYNAGTLTDAGLINSLSNLGLVSSGYWPNGSANTGLTNPQLERQYLQAQIDGQLMDNQYRQAQTAYTNRR